MPHCLRSERQHVVDKLMVEFVAYILFDMGEIGNHSGIIQLLGAAMYGYNPIVAVYAGTLALVVEFKAVSGGYFKSFAYVVHFIRYNMVYSVGGFTGSTPASAASLYMYSSAASRVSSISQSLIACLRFLVK